MSAFEWFNCAVLVREVEQASLADLLTDRLLFVLCSLLKAATSALFLLDDKAATFFLHCSIWDSAHRSSPSRLFEKDGSSEDL